MDPQISRRRDIVFQFLIVLSGIDPPVWRRIQVPGAYSFWDLHVAIQDAMGWLDYHLHQFKINDPARGQLLHIGMPIEDGWDDITILPDYQTPISEVFTWDNEVASYVYDFGDDGRHVVAFESWFGREKGVQYPRCISGAGNCPPEDCGGPTGYEMFLEAIRDPDHEEHQSYLEWVGGDYDPEDFDPTQVEFDDPTERWHMAFGGG